MSDRIYQHTAIYQCETKEVMTEFVRWLIAGEAWFAATPATLTVETSKVRPPRDGRLGPPMKGIRLVDPNRA